MTFTMKKRPWYNRVGVWIESALWLGILLAMIVAYMAFVRLVFG